MSNTNREILLILKNTLRMGFMASVLAIGAQAQTATPTPVPTPTPMTPADTTTTPNVAPNYVAPNRPLPPAERVGVDVSNQKPLSLNEVISMALENSNDIETAQTDVKLAEFNLFAARGVYDPKIALQTSYQRSKVPTASTLGSVDGAITSSGIVTSFGATGFSPYAGGSYTSNFQQSRETTNNPLNAFNRNSRRR